MLLVYLFGSKREWLTSNQASEHKASDVGSKPQCDKKKEGRTQMNCDEYSICLQIQIYEQKEDESNWIRMNNLDLNKMWQGLWRLD